MKTRDLARGDDAPTSLLCARIMLIVSEELDSVNDLWIRGCV